MKYIRYKILKKKSFHCKRKELLAQFQHIYDELEDENDAIADKYSYNAKGYTITLTSKIIISVYFCKYNYPFFVIYAILNIYLIYM
jgi:hypothetical protein